MEKSFSITKLPKKIIRYILDDGDLDFRDIVNFSQTCKRMRKIVLADNNLWRKRFFGRWPDLIDVYEKEEADEVDSWYEEVKLCAETKKTIRNLLSSMSQKHSKKCEVACSNMREYDKLLNGLHDGDPFAYHFIMDELTEITDKDIWSCNLTHKYYALKIIRYLTPRHLIDEWDIFTSLPECRQTSERIAVFVSQWCQPEKRIYESHVSEILDGIALRVKHLIRLRAPNHPVLYVPEASLDTWKQINIADNMWDKETSRYVLELISEVMFGTLNFTRNVEGYLRPEDTFIEEALQSRSASRFILMIIYESVARRLGVKCVFDKYMCDVVLRWQDKHKIDDRLFIPVIGYHIDFIDGEVFSTEWYQAPPNFNPSEWKSGDVVKHILNDTETAIRGRLLEKRRILRLRSIAGLRNTVDTIHNIKEVMKTSEKEKETFLIKLIDDVSKMIQDPYELSVVSSREDTLPKKRHFDVKYAIGMILKNKTDGYFCAIIGWILPHYTNSYTTIFYNVIVEDGSIKYIAQDCLLMVPITRHIRSEELGRYFYKYCGTHFLPNKELKKRYPGDADVRNRLLMDDCYKRMEEDGDLCLG